MNFLEMSWTGQTLEHGLFDYKLSADTARQLDTADSDQVTLGIRPEDIRPAESTDANAIDITVKVTEPLGDSTYAYFDLGEQTLTMEMPGDRRIAEGEELTIQFPEDRIHLFDGATEVAIKNREFGADDEAEWGVSA